MPQISVIVPVYMAESYLADCIDSILNQTFSDLEIILVNDGSPDGSGAICDAYAAREARVSVHHQENQGQAAARNHALALAKGDWICFVDSDDLIHPQMLQLLYDAAVKGNCGISMCRMLEAVELPESFMQPQQEQFAVATMDEETLLGLHDAGQYPSWVACGKLIRRAFIERHPFTPGRVYEDNAAVCHWVCEAEKMAMMPHELYFYRGNPDSTTKKAFSLKRLDYLWALEEIIALYSRLGYLQLRQRFVDRYVEAAAGDCWMVRQELNRPDILRQIERDLQKLLKKYKLQLSREQTVRLLEAMHPKLVRLYYPMDAVVGTLKETGVSGLMKKAAGKLRKGENP